MLGDVQVSPGPGLIGRARKVISAVSASVPRGGQASQNTPGGSSGQVERSHDDEPPDLQPVRLTREELAVVAASLHALARQLDGFRGRLSALEASAQVSSGSTCRSTRDSRSPKRSRSS
jgi:hypothetical protein